MVKSRIVVEVTGMSAGECYAHIVIGLRLASTDVFVNSSYTLR